MRGARRIGEHHPGREGGRIAVGREIGRGRFLKLAGGGAWAASLGLLTACATDARRGAGEEMSAGRQEIGSGAARGRLLASPAPPPPQPSGSGGLRRLGLGSGRDGLLYVPRGHDATGATPLALTLHGAGGDARSGISHLIGLADEFGLILLAPESRGRTWDVLVGGYGPDVGFIDRALGQTFDRLAVDPGRLAITGFSDGASYALSLGLTNGDLFTHAIAFSPGFAAPADRRGKPPVFVSHGKRDRVLPIERCSRRIVPQLEREGYEVSYREFDGPHTVPGEVARGALEWLART